MINYTEIPTDGEIWEQFAEEFLTSLGLSTDSPPDRGPDGGKDLLMTEVISGPVHTEPFRWLVSCKHYAQSGSSVSEISHEKNILERVKAFKADGFLGFYSTIPSSGLNTRLRALSDTRDLKAYKIFSGKLIENELVSVGKSWLIRRYFPESYKSIRPLHKILDELVELRCDCCGKDLLYDLYEDQKNSVIAEVIPAGEEKTLDVYFACKGECDSRLEKAAYNKYGAITAWEDIHDLATPNQYLRWILALMNHLKAGYQYEDEAFAKVKHFIMALSQKVMREVSEKERVRLRELINLLG